MEEPIEVAVVSGKGGSGKTTLTSSLARLIESKVVADCDIDAPNLHLVLKPVVKSTGVFQGGKVAVINEDICSACGGCLRACRFKAVRETGTPEGWTYSIDPLSCEGCAVCTRICPENAVSMKESAGGTWYVSDSEFGPFVHASLGSYQENSGELVNVVRSEARKVAARDGLRYVLIDGPPGIGSPVIATIAGVSLAVVMTEPTISGLHDFRRIIRLVRNVGVRFAGIINRYDLNVDMTRDIEEFFSREAIPLFGRIPFSHDVSRAIADCTPIVDLPNSAVADEIRKIAVRIAGVFALRE